jgi:hypothetical protein
MKYRTTAKEVKARYANIISCGYCDLQNLLKYKNPIAYSRGVCGWNFDVYDIDGIAIATGYRCMPSKNSKSDYDLVREYDDKARGKTKEEREQLLKEFIQKATN